MKLRPRLSFKVAIVTAAFCAAAIHAPAQALQQPLDHLGDHRHARSPLPAQPSVSSQSALTPDSASSAKPSPGVRATTAAPVQGSAHSLLDEPATPARIEVSGDRLSINATNASLSEVIRQVATRTGMQVEGNSRDERVFGSYGPGSAPEVLSALLYDSGYNVIMVGSTADGAPRRLVLSARTAGATPQQAPPQEAASDDDEDEAPMEMQQPPQPPGMQPPPGPTVPGQPKTPQQMLEELQRMHQGQEPPDVPHPE